MTEDQDLEDFVDENQEVLHKIIRHHDDPFIRGCALALLIEAGGVRGIEEIEQDLTTARNQLI